MTKMQPKGEDLVCPECGYKYCANRQPYTYDDHNHSQYQTYTRQVSYSGHPPRQAPVSSQGAYSQPRQSAAQTPPSRPAAQGTSGQTQPGQSRPNAYPGTAPIASRDSYPRTQTASAQPRQGSGSSSAQKPKSPVQVIVTIFVIIFIADFVISMLAGLFSLFSAF